MFDIRVAVYELDDFIDVLPVSKVTWTASLNDTSTFSVSTHRHSGFLGDEERGELLDQVFDEDMSLVVEVRNREGEWVQFPHAYGLVLDEDEDATEPNRELSLEALGSDYDLSSAVNLDPSVLDEEGRWQFDLVTPGVYLIETLTKAQGYDLALALDWDFTATHDSASVAWPKSVKMALEPGITPRDLLDSLADQALIDWRMNGNTLQMFVADSPTGMRRDKTAVELAMGREVMKAPQRRTHRDRVDDVLVMGDEGLHLVVPSPHTTRPRGRRALVNKQGGVGLEATALLLAQAMLNKGEGGRKELTRDLRFTEDVEFWPYLDYLPGDVIVTTGHRGEYEELRVFEIRLTKDNNGLDGSIIVADRFLEREVRETRRMNGLLGGSTISGGTNAQPTPPPVTIPVDPVPKPPAYAGFDVQAISIILPSGQSSGAIVASWDAVTEDINDETIQILRYIVLISPHSEDAWEAVWSGPETSMEYRDLRFHPGTQWDVVVAARASSGGAESGASQSITITIPADSTIPPKLSTPILSSSHGVVTVAWDFLSATGQEMPPDYWRTLVWVTGEAEPRLMEAAVGVIGIFDYPAGTTLEIRLQGQDHSKNVSFNLSDPAEITVTSVLSETDFQAQMAKATSYGENLYPDPLFTEGGRTLLREAQGWILTAGEGKAVPDVG